MSARRVGALTAVAIATAAGIPMAAGASSHSDNPYARSAAASGVVYGGRTSQGWPVMIEFNKTGRRVVQAAIGLHLPCASGNFALFPDRYINMPVNKRRKFGASFGPETATNDDGTKLKSEGSMSGGLNRARSKVSGKWHLKVTYLDNADGVIDTCQTTIAWSAKQ
jgi:hypothetical protein